MLIILFYVIKSNLNAVSQHKIMAFISTLQ